MKSSPFYKMLQEKRTKILMLVLILFIANYVYKADCVSPDLIQTVINGKSGKEIVCIANGKDANSAVDWTYPIPGKSENLPETESHYIPHMNNVFDCNFEIEKICSGDWALKNWTISESFEPITDARWEDFRTLFVWNETHNMINNKIQIPSTFDIGISVRANNGTTILLCEGWLPDKYPCFIIQIGLSDNKKISLEVNDNSSKPVEFQRYADIFLEHEWKHFKLSYTDKGSLELTDIIRNTTLLYYNQENNMTLKPIYLFTKSESPSLWKIHNNKFLYSNISTVTKFGPPLPSESSNICVSLYVSMCKSCSIKFFVYKNETEDVLAEIDFQQMIISEFQWKNIRLKRTDNQEDTMQLYVETKSIADDKFWAIDDVRICNDNEIKITTLPVPKNLGIEEETKISCHALLSPEWTPNKQHLSPPNDLPILQYELSPTTIKLSWTETNQPHLQRYYAVKYEGSDLCGVNTSQQPPLQSKERIKSNGWIVTSKNEITIENLIPYTYYSITFEDLIYLQNRTISLNTEKTEKPMPIELPQNVRIKPTENSAKVFFDGAKCNATYGPLVYKVTFSNEILNFSTILIDTRNSYGVEQLLSFTNYNLTIETARNISSFNNTNLKFIRYYNFTTRPDVAPAIRNLEVYETDETSIAVRFDLPEQPKGKPKSTRIQYCHPLFTNTCKFEIDDIRKCEVWSDKYCADIKNLITNYSYLLVVSLKNENTHNFGEEVTVTATSENRVPGPPENVTSKVIHYNKKTDYCDLNISWTHPRDQKGAITAFDIFLIEQVETVATRIHEVLQIPNKNYQREYVISIKFVPYSAKYNISVRAINNKYKSKFASIEAETDHIRNYLDQVPTIVNHTGTSLQVHVPALDRRLGTYTLTIIVQKASSEAIIDQELSLLADDELCLEQVETWIAKVIEVAEDRIPLIVVGDGTEIYSTTLNKTVVNKPLQPNEEYCINFIIKNVYKKTEHIVVYHEKHINVIILSTVEELHISTNYSKLIILIILLVLIIAIAVGAIMYRYGKNTICRKKYRQEGEHIYEAMPFDDYNEPNVVYNATYDKLNH